MAIRLPFELQAMHPLAIDTKDMSQYGVVSIDVMVPNWHC